MCKSLFILLNLPLQVLKKFNKDLGDNQGYVELHLDVLEDLACDFLWLVEYHLKQVLGGLLILFGALARVVVRSETAPEERVRIVGTQEDLIDV